MGNGPKEEASKQEAVAPQPLPRSNPTRIRTWLGLAGAAPIDDQHKDLEHHDLVWSRIRLAWREPFAEFFGTFTMVLFGDGTNPWNSFGSSWTFCGADGNVPRGVSLYF